ncbi:MAG: SixA phosphatase family protein, partial [Chitinophagales bacterium]
MADMDRPLNNRGKYDAPRIGTYLKQQGLVPELLLSSPAKRARATAYSIAKNLDYEQSAIRFIDALYTFHQPNVILETVAQIGTTESNIL